MQPWILFAILSAISASFVAIFGKMGMQGIDSTLGTTIRSIIMTFFLVVTTILLGSYKSIGSIDGRTLTFIALSGVAGALSWIWYFLSLKTGPAGGVAALDRLSIIFVIVFAAIFLGEALTWKAILGTIMIAVGAILIAFI